MRQSNVYRNGRIHVCREQCATCIFRPGNLMQLQPGRVADMVREATKAESCIPCHSTLDGDHSVCRGFFDRHATSPLQIAQRIGLITFTDLPEEP